jgi:hypothetical protein
MLKIIKQSKHLLRKVIKPYKNINFSVWGHLKVMVASYKIKFIKVGSGSRAVSGSVMFGNVS